METEQEFTENLEIVNQVIERVTANRQACQALAVLLEELLARIFPEAQKVQARAKTNASIAGKILKKYIGLRDPGQIFLKLTDLVGARVIFLQNNSVRAADAIVRKIFVVDDRNSENVGDRLSPQEFGYQSLHYIIRCDADWLNAIEKEFKLDVSILRSLLVQSGTLSAELQIRSWLQHIWAAIGHDSIYKSDREIPRSLQRSWNALAAVFESADGKIVSCLEQLEKNRLSEPYYNQDTLRKKIYTLQIIILVLQKQHSDGPQQVQWDRKTFENDLRELRRLYCLAGQEDKFLEWIRKNSLECSFLEGDSWKTPLEEALADGDFRQAFEQNPLHPRVLLLYLPNERKNYSCDPIFGALLRQSIERCDNMIASFAELPWAFAGKAFALMLLLNAGRLPMTAENIDQVYEAILRLIDLCNDRSVSNLDKHRLVATADSLNALQTLRNAMKINFFKKEPAGRAVLPIPVGERFAAPLFMCVRELLELGLYAHSDCGKKRDPRVIVAGGCDSLQGKPLEDFRKFFQAAATGGKCRIWFLTGAGHSGICSLTKQDFGENNRVRRFGIESDENADVRSPYSAHSVYEALLGWKELKRQRHRFDDVALVGFGIPPVPSGGERAVGGVANLECRIALAFGARVTVIGHASFLDQARAFERIPYWSSHPSLVRLPLPRSDEPQNRSFQQNPELLSQLKPWREAGFPEPMMLRVFMLFRPFHENDYSAGRKDPLVLNIHRIKRLRTMKAPKDLDKLSSMDYTSEEHRKMFFSVLCRDTGNLKKSIEKKIEKIRASLPEVPPADADDQVLADYWTQVKKCSPALLDYPFGEKEHARWYIERWLQGLRYGPNKIVKGVDDCDKKNPCMVAWFDLDDDTIERDTDFLNRYVVASATDFNAIERLFNRSRSPEN